MFDARQIGRQCALVARGPFTAVQSNDCYLRRPDIKVPLLDGDLLIGVTMGSRVLGMRMGHTNIVDS
jgi:hypothetical protein